MNEVTLPEDFSEFLRCLNAREVRYLIVGGHAVSETSRDEEWARSIHEAIAMSQGRARAPSIGTSNAAARA